MSASTSGCRRAARRLGTIARTRLAAFGFAAFWFAAVAGVVVFSADGALAAAAARADCPPSAAPIDAEHFRAALRDAVADHGFLWRIERDGRASYLYGTIHVAGPEWMFPGTLTKQALAASDTVALELDLLDPGLAGRLANSAKASAGEALPAELAERIDRRTLAECMDPARLRALAPEFQVAALGVAAARREGVDAAYAIDLVLAVAGRVLGKQVVSLETPESQAGALRAPTREATIELVRDGLDDLDSGHAGALVARLADVWRTSDLAALDDYERWCGCARSDADRQAMKVLIDDRNVLLAARIDALHGTGHAVFAAVGSLHMIGPQGLPALMRGRGFRVDRLVPAP